jgi:hypothetical protein
VPRSAGMVAHAIQRIKNRVFAHVTGRLMLVREHVLPLPGKGLQGFQFTKR